MKLTGFAEALDHVRSFERDLTSPVSFYAEHRAEYHRQAVVIARKLLLALRPDSTHQDEWHRKVEMIVDRVATDLIASGGGLIFAFAAPRDRADGSLSSSENRPAEQVMSFEDIERWVQAGLDGEPGGKRITAIDWKLLAEKGTRGVASVVMKAYYSSRPDARYTRLRRAIQRYFHGARQQDAEPLLDAVSAAWKEHFAAVIPRDLRKWAVARSRR